MIIINFKDQTICTVPTVMKIHIIHGAHTDLFSLHANFTSVSKLM